MFHNVTQPLHDLLARYRPDEVPVGPGPVIAYVGRDVPRELLRAAGATPYRLAGRPGHTEPADRFCGGDMDPVARSQLSRVLTGELADCAGLVISGDCEGSLRLFLYLREIQRLEPFDGVPPFTFLDLLHLPQRTSALYNATRLRQLADTLGEWTGTAVTDGALAERIRESATQRSHYQGLQRLRSAVDGPRISGVDALRVFGAGMTRDDDVHPVLLEQLVARGGELPVLEGVPVFLTGSAHDRPDVYRLIESRGAVVVGEDHDWGALSAQSPVDTGTNPFPALAAAYGRGAPASAGYGIAERAEHTARQAANAGARLVVVWLRAGDDAPAWDVHAQRDALQERGIPVVVLPGRPYTVEPDTALTEPLDGALARLSRPGVA
jgi:benzoyl-CoA reductase/2-hydroxyglutaryl-CoA dehydratase subunit BcrC/BadD/HgdB